MTLPEEPTPSPGIPLAELTIVERLALAMLAADGYEFTGYSLMESLNRRVAAYLSKALQVRDALDLPALERQAHVRGMREAAQVVRRLHVQVRKLAPGVLSDELQNEHNHAFGQARDAIERAACALEQS